MVSEAVCHHSPSACVFAETRLHCCPLLWRALGTGALCQHLHMPFWRVLGSQVLGHGASLAGAAGAAAQVLGHACTVRGIAGRLCMFRPHRSHCQVVLPVMSTVVAAADRYNSSRACVYETANCC